MLSRPSSFRPAAIPETRTLRALPTIEDVQEKLANAQNTVAELTAAQSSATMFNNFTISSTYRNLSRLLIIEKELPPVYFRNAAEAAGIDKSIFRKWKPHRWPTQSIKSQDRLNDVTQTLIRVWLDVWPYAEETYWEAHARLVERIHWIHEEYDISYNQIANYLLLPHSVLTDLLTKTKENPRQPKHCPWSMLEALDVAPDKIKEAHPKPRKSAYTLQHSQTRDYHHNIATRQVVIDALKKQTILEGDDCPKCGAPWGSVTFISRHHEFKTLKEYSCIPCGATIYCGPIIPVMIHRRGPCEHCGAPPNNLSKIRENSRGQAIMLCKACNECSIRPTPSDSLPKEDRP